MPAPVFEVGCFWLVGFGSYFFLGFFFFILFFLDFLNVAQYGLLFPVGRFIRQPKSRHNVVVSALVLGYRQAVPVSWLGGLLLDSASDQKSLPVKLWIVSLKIVGKLAGDVSPVPVGGGHCLAFDNFGNCYVVFALSLIHI